MKKKVTSGIIILVTFASIGLLFIQVVWIKNAVKVKEATFVRDVNQTMSGVVFTINKLWYREIIFNRNNYYYKYLGRFQKYDSINRDICKSMMNISSADEFSQILYKQKKVNNAIQDLWRQYYRPVDNNFFTGHKELIDSLIGQALLRQNIKTKYEFGVYNPTNNSMIIQKTGRYPDKLLRNSFVYNLMSINSPFNFPPKLLVYFPDEKAYLISRLYHLLFVSFILFLIIIGSFSYSIFTIKKQKKLSEMKNDLINNMTHEFKTPISTISLACEALKDKDVKKSDEIYNSYISVIDEENKRLGTMAEHILRSATIESGKLKLNLSLLNMHLIISSAVNSKQINAEDKDGHIEMELKAKNPSVEGDKIQLTNVINNLLDNALKYTLKDPIIKISTKDLQDGLLIAVKDNGIGISKANQKKIFEKLFRVHIGNRHDFKGFGLGLSYVKAVVEHHQGKVTVESEPEKGSIFYVYLPTKKNIL